MTDPFAGIPKHSFGAILADPPWRFETWSDKGLGRAPDYGVSTLCDIAELPIKSLPNDDCILFLWTYWPLLEEAFYVIKSWGFQYKTCAFSWMKTSSFGLGYWTRQDTEVCLLATRGRPKRLNADVRQGIIEPRREHSRKPDCVHERIERLVKGPYLELWARRSERLGWTFWGNEIRKFNKVKG